MKDKALVVNIKADFARVEVQCFIESCHKCSARSLCIGQNQSNRLLIAKNPLKANPGDEVEIEIPETNYNRLLILLFGTLILASLSGLGAGYLCASLLSLPSQVASLLGLLLALGAAFVALARYLRKKNKKNLYPVIIDIIKKGDTHG